MGKASDPAERLAELRQAIRRHNHLYHVQDQPEISDEAYDALMRELIELEQERPDLVVADSPTQRVGGAPVAGFATAVHARPMLSLDSSAKEEDLRAFDARLRRAVGDDVPVTYSLEPKIDGLSVELVYQDGVLDRAVTRGDGTAGEVITAGVRTIRTVPLRLADGRAQPDSLSVRGEIYLPIDAFDDVNAELINQGKQPFANPRNVAAGTVRQQDTRLTATRPLRIYCYDVLAGAEGLTTQAEILAALADWGFPVNELNAAAPDLAGVLEYFRRIETQRDDLPYEIDGVVVKLQDLAARERLGTTSHHPRWAYAFKFQPRKEVSQVLRIVPSVGRTGVVTPIALLRPVNIGGVTVARANLHNVDDIVRKDIREGDDVRVERAGDVIPQVIERVDTGAERGAPFTMPTECPSCGTTLVRVGPYTVCPNSLECPAQLVGRLTHFGSRMGLDIEGLGEQTARQLVETGLVRSVPQLFDLTAERIKTLEGFGDKSAANLAAAIEDARNPELARFLYALGIPEVGSAVARTLARHFGTFAAVRAAGIEELLSVEGVGAVMAEQIQAYFHAPSNVEAIDALLTGRLTPKSESVVTNADGGGLTGKTFVFTGAMDALSREQAEELVRSLGGKASGSVSAKTTFLVAGEGGGSKLTKAQDLGVSVMTEQEFLTLVSDMGASIPDSAGASAAS